VTDLFTLEDDKSRILGDILSTFSFCLTLGKGSCFSDWKLGLLFPDELGTLAIVTSLPVFFLLGTEGAVTNCELDSLVEFVLLGEFRTLLVA
jgi:hypothetical protein